MRKLFFEEYQEFIVEIKQVLFQAFRDFSSSRDLLAMDYTNGRIDFQVYDKISKFRIDDYIGDEYPQYSLTKKQVEDVKKYGHLSSSGELYLNSVNPFFENKLKLYKKIFESVRIYCYFSELSSEERIKVLTAIVESEISRRKEKAEQLLFTPETKLSAEEKLQELNEKGERFFSCIHQCTDEQLINILGSIYGIDYKYYEWFNNMTLQELRRDNKLYDDHVILLKETDVQLSFGQRFYQQHIDYNQEFLNLCSKLQQFNLGFIGLQSELAVSRGILSGLGFHKKSNIDELRSLFERLTSIEGSSEFVESFSVGGEDSFDNYFLSIYSGIEYVEPQEFMKRFVLFLNDFYNRRIEVIKEDMEVSLHDIIENIRTGKAKVGLALRDAKLFSDINISLDVNIGLKDDGLDESECSRIFDDMKWYLVNRYEADKKFFAKATLLEKRK